MKTLLVATDFSAASHNAAIFSVSLAQVLNSKIQLIHVYQEPAPTTAAPDNWTLAVSSLRMDQEARLNQEIQWLSAHASVKVSGWLATGFTGEAISTRAEDTRADLVVLGKKNRSDRFFGSVITRMIRKTTRPLLIVPENYSFRPFNHISLAIDFTEMIGSDSLEPLFALVHHFDAALKVIHIDRKGGEMKTSEISAKLQLGKALSRVNYIYEREAYSEVDFGILDYVSGHPTDLLVMIAHPHTIFEKWLGNSHTALIAQHLPVPLLVLKNKGV